MHTAKYDKYRIISFTDRGKELAGELILKISKGKAADALLIEEGASLDDFVKENFDRGNVLIFIGATAIAVRAIAPYIEDKTEDPAVIVIDERGMNVIPVLSGHIGGANKEARMIANLLGATAVITTATDIGGEFAVDVYASEKDFAISDMKKAKEFTSRLLKEGKAFYYVDEELADMICTDTGYENIVRVPDIKDIEGKNSFVISCRDDEVHNAYLKLIPRCVVAGMGCKKGTDGEALYSFCLEKLKENGIDKNAVKVIASVSIKKDEEGLKYVADKLDAYFVTFESEDLMAIEGDFESSEFAREITGCDNVCERAVAASGAEKILVHKTKGTGMTFAAGIMREFKRGKLKIVGIGPGNYENMTIRAADALSRSDVIAGYTVYCELVRPYYKDKEYISTPMMGEEKRVEMALAEAAKGKEVSLICSGDAGVYGMAGLAYLKGCDFDMVDIEVIPGVTAALSGAALLGAPLIHDFCLISMSDRLTPIEVIEKRLRNAASADMAIVIYNPESKGRKGYLAHACDILMEIISPDTVCGIANNIGREKEGCRIMTLAELKSADADMFSTVFIGNSTTRNIDEKMVTQRGYKSER
ncbi:MAG: precorrin-3B C(17)-methyltransferase [Butyrivibrio sp.]|nr:precorrin-3B C(17)-methyltransferase [Butyrivibrio sp.]